MPRGTERDGANRHRLSPTHRSGVGEGEGGARGGPAAVPTWTTGQRRPPLRNRHCGRVERSGGERSALGSTSPCRRRAPPPGPASTTTTCRCFSPTGTQTHSRTSRPVRTPRTTSVRTLSTSVLALSTHTGTQRVLCLRSSVFDSPHVRMRFLMERCPMWFCEPVWRLTDYLYVYPQMLGYTSYR